MDFLTWLLSFYDSFDEEFRGNPDATKIASNIVSSVSIFCPRSDHNADRNWQMFLRTLLITTPNIDLDNPYKSAFFIHKTLHVFSTHYGTFSFWLRVVQTATPQMRKRFVDNCLIYLAAVHQQAVNFENHHMPTVEEFLVLRRDTSAAKPVLDFLEYTLNLDKLPDSFHEHPTVKQIKESCNDILS